MNALINTLDLESGNIGGLIVHAFALSLVIVVALTLPRFCGQGVKRRSCP
jgi:hypothetical protein